MSQTQATQPEVANYITDIFGADSDDEAESNIPAPKTAINYNELEDDEQLEDSDDEAPKPNRLKDRVQSQRTVEEDRIVDSDDEADIHQQEKRA
jgi:hypothetical protein